MLSLLFCFVFIHPRCFAINEKNFNNIPNIINEEYSKLDINDLENKIPQETKKDLEEIDINLKDPQNINNFNIFKILGHIFSKSFDIIKSPLIIFSNCKQQ